MKKRVTLLALLAVLAPSMLTAYYYRRPNVGFSFGIGAGYPGYYYGRPGYYGYPYGYYGPGFGLTIPLGGYNNDEEITTSRIARDNAGKAYWKIINKTNTTLTILSDKDEIRHLAPGSSGTLYREDDFEFTVKANGTEHKLTTDEHVVTLHMKDKKITL